MQVNFNSIADNIEGGSKWKSVFDLYWPAYRNWLVQEKYYKKTNLEIARKALQVYMPEMVPAYENLCSIANADILAATFLTGYKLPEYTGACAQAVMTKGEIQLVRNYDYLPSLLEGVFIHTNWNGKKVMGMSDCLIGLVDGINDDGLAVSISFGGQNTVGDGFGIPFIIRYVLEFCSNVEQAVKALKRIPSHMAYNITVLDKEGKHKTVMVAPGKKARVLKDKFCTNHQEGTVWESNAEFNNTIERAAFLKKTLAKRKLSPTDLVNAFLNPPLYNTEFSKGNGTLYTAVYKPLQGTAALIWKVTSQLQYIDNFKEGQIVMTFADELKTEKAINNKQKTVAQATLRDDDTTKKKRSTSRKKGSALVSK